MFLLPLLALALTAAPADAMRSPVHRSWSVPDGLPQSSVHALVQSASGWIYAGTQEGVARFDGYAWEAIPLMSTSAACRLVTSLAAFEDTVWAGTLRCGLFEIHGTEVAKVPGIDSPDVIALHADAFGGLWVATQRSVSRRGRDGRVETLVKGAVQALAVGTKGFWVAVDGKLRFIGNEGTVREVPALAGKDISTLALGPHGLLWVGTADDGLWRVKDGEATRLPGPVSVSAILEDKDGTLWFGDRDGGLLRRTPEGFRSVRGMFGIPVMALAEDVEGSLWIGSSGHGVHQLRPAQIQNVGEAEGLSSPVTWCVAQDARGRVFIGTENGRVVELLGKGMRVHELPEPLARASVFDLSFAKDGALWMATRKGFAVMRGETILPLDASWGLPATAGSILARADGTVWAGTKAGLFRSDGGRFARAPQLPDGVGVLSLRETSDGALWVGSTQGLYKLRGSQVVHYGTSDGLGGNRILSITEDQDRPGAVWVGSADGIARVDHGRIHTVRRAQGLINELDFALVDDGEGRLWVGTDRGILRLEKSQLEALFSGKRQTLDAADFGMADGMENPECNGYSTSASLLGKDGQVWFATMGGAVHFDPERLVPSIPVTSVTIIAARSGGAPLRDGGRIDREDPKLEIHYAAPTFLDPIRLRYRYRLDGFDKGWVEAGTRRYALYTNLPPGNYLFRVQAYIPGQWASSEASFSFVRPGKLTEHWAFYPALALLALGLLGVLVFMQMRQLERRVRERTRELREAMDRIAQTERSIRINERMASIGTLAAGVAHEINNPLAYLSANVDFALEELRDASTPLFADRITEVISALSEASEGAQRVTNIVKDLKTFSRTESGPPGLVDVCKVFHTALNLSRNTLTRKARLKVELESVPPVRGDNGRLTQVLVNLLINAAQAIDGGAPDKNEIAARCSTDADGWIRAEIKDSGTGISPENLQHIFDPFFTTKPVGVGTGLGLSICHGIVSDMGGRIEVESQVGEGTTFILKLPPASDTVTGSHPVMPRSESSER